MQHNSIKCISCKYSYCGKYKMNKPDKELTKFLELNKEIWKIWEANGVSSETVLTVDFNFYASSEGACKALSAELKDSGISYKEKATRTLLILKGWQITASITQQWSFATLQGKTGYMYILSKQTNTVYEGLGALMPANQ
jgi:hypothetical protein